MKNRQKPQESGIITREEYIKQISDLWFEEQEKAMQENDNERLQNLRDWEESVLGGVTNRVTDENLKKKIIEIKKSTLK